MAKQRRSKAASQPGSSSNVDVASASLNAAATAAATPSQSSSRSFSHVANKMKRQDLYRAHRRERAKEKLKRRAQRAKEEKGEEGAKRKKARLESNIPRTIENTRLYNPRIVSAPNSHPGRGPSQAVREAERRAQALGEMATEDQDDDQDQDGDADESAERGGTGGSVYDDEDAEEAAEQGSDVDHKLLLQSKVEGGSGRDFTEAETAAEADEEQGVDALLEAEEDGSAEGDEDDPHAPPALLITTSMPSNSTSPHLASGKARAFPAERTRDFVNELLNVFPGGEYRPRHLAQGASLGRIAGWARKRGFGGLLVVGEAEKRPVSLTIVGLPHGPTAFFRLSNVVLGREISGHARPTPHTPELILNNFTTTLGHEVGSLLRSLVPRVPQLEGRQALTAHNQRDFVFVRRHRYEFRAGGERAALQEIGPRFTLKVRKLKQGLPKGAGAWDGVVRFDGTHADVDAEGKPVLDPKLRAAPEPSQAGGSKARRADADEEQDVLFEWKPRMGVDRRNFYL